MRKTGCAVTGVFILATVGGCSGTAQMSETTEQADANATIAASVPSTDIVLVSLEAVMAGRDPGQAKAVAARRGYDNQPAFSPDGQYVLYSRIDDGGQSDVYQFDIASGKTRRVTQTAQSEYSPTPLADGGFSCIQVALDGTQRLWRYSDQGVAQAPLRADITGVGYHAWLGASELALFIVDEPLRLEVVSLKGEERTEIATGIGRSVLRTPGGALSFVRSDPQTQTRALYERDPVSGRLTRRAAMPVESEDLVWLADGSVLVADARTLYRLAPGAQQWTQWVNLARSVAGDISRMAADPNGRWLALVVSESE